MSFSAEFDERRIENEWNDSILIRKPFHSLQTNINLMALSLNGLRSLGLDKNPRRKLHSSSSSSRPASFTPGDILTWKFAQKRHRSPLSTDTTELKMNTFFCANAWRPFFEERKDSLDSSQQKSNLAIRVGRHRCPIYVKSGIVCTLQSLPTMNMYSRRSCWRTTRPLLSCTGN